MDVWFEEVPEIEDQNSFLMDQCDIMDVFDEEWMTAIIENDFQISLSDENIKSSCFTLTQPTPPSPPPPPPQDFTIERPKKHHKPENYNNLDLQSTLTPVILKFDNKSNQSVTFKTGPVVRGVNPEDEVVRCSLVSQSTPLGNRDMVAKAGTGTKHIRPPSQTYDHITAERKRREKLSERFIALTTIVPGLKKMDKASVLRDAIIYLKQLQEKVKILEEQTTKQTIESVVLVKKSQLLTEDENNNYNMHGNSNDHLPEIEARFSDKSVLMRIHCEKHKGVLVKIISEIEKMNLTILSTSISPFGTLALDVTIIAEMEKEFNMTLEDFVKNLRSDVRRHTRTSDTNAGGEN